jgi:PAS domain S-box-containing protein
VGNFDKLIAVNSDGFIRFRLGDTTLTFVNQAFITQFGLSGTPDSWLGKPAGEILSGLLWNPDRAGRLQAAPEILKEEFGGRIADGREKRFRIQACLTHTGKPAEPAVEASFHDLPVICETHEDCEREKEWLTVTLKSIGDGVITTDIEGRITLLNSVAESLTEWDADTAIGRYLPEIFRIQNEQTGHPCENPAGKVLATGHIIGLANNTVLVTRTGKKRVIADSGAPIFDRNGNIIGVVLVFRDVTGSRRLQEELQKSQKLESIGILAGGIAHDFNNILTGIFGYIGLAKLDLQPGAKSFEKLTRAERAIARARGLSGQLLSLTKGKNSARRCLSLPELVEEEVNFALRGTNVRLECNCPGNLHPVEVDEGQISQVLHNLTINAVQAMPNGGVLRITGENVVLTAKSLIPLPNGNFVKITIQDEGIGIPREHLSRIFDPFFTTKQKGSGLGLSISYSLISDHGGYLTVESELGKGSRFFFYLPKAAGDFLWKSEPVKLSGPGRGRILIMDDEESIREITGEFLASLNFDVEFAFDGDQAFEKFSQARNTGRPFAAVILDLTIPGQRGGEEIIKELKTIDPEVLAIASSGYSNSSIMANPEQFGFIAAIPKPYDIHSLGNIIRQVLTGNPITEPIPAKKTSRR